MLICTVCTQKYDIDLMRLMARRLEKCGSAYGLAEGMDGVTVTMRGAGARQALSGVLAKVLCHDLQYFEMARMTDEMPLELAEKQAVLSDAIRDAREGETLESVRAVLEEYLGAASLLNLEGFLQFRMQEDLKRWELSVEHAAAQQLLSREYSEFLGALTAFAQLQDPQISELSVCLHPDGSCTLTDDSDTRIEYVDCSEDGILGLLVSMAPLRLTVYDLSEGSCRHLTETIAKVFAGKVKIYR